MNRPDFPDASDWLLLSFPGDRLFVTEWSIGMQSVVSTNAIEGQLRTLSGTDGQIVGSCRENARDNREL